MSATTSTTDAATCDYCGAELRPSLKSRHEAVCYARPGLWLKVREVMENPNKPGTAISLQAYQAIATSRGVPSYQALSAQLGNWHQLCRWVGLEPGPRRGYEKGTRPGTQAKVRIAHEAKVLAEVAAAVDEDRAMQRELDGRGLEVCRVTALPDGRVRCMLR